MQEPEITINGARLTTAQAMTLRVAITSFREEMKQEDALGSDETGRVIAEGYAAAAAQVLRIMLPST